LNWPRFTGGGQSIALRGRWGTITRDFSFSFDEPYLFNKPVSFGLDVYDTRTENRNVDFREERMGIGTTFSKAFTDFIRAGLGYKIENVELFDIESDASPDVRLFEGDNFLSRLRAFLNRDTRDNVFFPTRGWVAGISGELIGTFLGGDEDYYILQASSTKYWSFGDPKHVIEWRVRLGAADDLGSDQVPVFDRFFAGGFGTVRGYNYRRVGPIEGGSAIGGATMVIVNLEYTFPIPYLENFKGAAFVDAGDIERDSYDLDFGEFRVSIGPGIKINTPIGPLAFYYGLPIANRDVEDKNGRFEFSLSRSF
jgi:outer membrane protein insertion porin family